MTTMEYKEITFLEAVILNGKTSAFVIRGGGAEEHREGWIDGINNQLVNEEKIFTAPITEFYILPVSVGRTDIVMVYGADQGADMGRMAMWRLNWRGDISWLEDYIVNDAKYF